MILCPIPYDNKLPEITEALLVKNVQEDDYIMSYLPINLQYFAEEPKDNETPAEPAAEPKKTDDEPPKEPKQDDKTIPYDRFKQVNDDLKSFKTTFEELGIDGVDSLKTLMSDYQTRKQADEEKKREEMTEIERLQNDLKTKEEAEQTYKTQLDEFKSQVQREKVRNAFIQQAQAANIAYVEDAERLADLSGIKVNEDGKVEGIEDVVKSLIENKPFLLAQKKQEPKDVGNPSNYDDDQKKVSSEKLLQDAADLARRTGKLEDSAAYRKLKRQLNA